MTDQIYVGFIASLIWFFVGGLLYMNPIVANIYKAAESSPGVKKWDSIPKYLGFMFLIMLIPNMLWALVFTMIKPILSPVALNAGVVFALMLVVIKIIPRFFDMWIQSTYPDRLLVIELINGTIGCFVIALTFACLLQGAGFDSVIFNCLKNRVISKQFI